MPTSGRSAGQPTWRAASDTRGSVSEFTSEREGDDGGYQLEEEVTKESKGIDLLSKSIMVRGGVRPGLHRFLLPYP